jgi:hypothetical protein
MFIEEYKNGNGRVATAGSCATVALVLADRVIVANTGDSKAKLFAAVDDGYEIIKLSETHNIGKKKEQEWYLENFPSEDDIFICKRPGICYVKGRLQPTKVRIINDTIVTWRLPPQACRVQ